MKEVSKGKEGSSKIITEVLSEIKNSELVNEMAGILRNIDMPIWIDMGWKKKIADKKYFSIVAKEKNSCEISGLFLIKPEKSYLYLNGMVTKKKYRWGPTFKMLMKKLLEETRHRGFSKIRLHTSNSKLAKLLSKKYGFEGVFDSDALPCLELNLEKNGPKPTSK